MAQIPRIVVLASGCFDLLHPGHLAYFEAAKRLGDDLVVSITSDQYVKRQKGERRPFFPLTERIAMVASLKIVSKVMICDADDQVAIIQRVRPAFYAKGVDYGAGDPSGRLDREREAVEACGGAMAYIDAWPRYSSTSIMKALA